MYQLLIKFKRKTSGALLVAQGWRIHPSMHEMRAYPSSRKTPWLWEQLAWAPQLLSLRSGAGSSEGWSLGAPGRRTEKSVRRTCREAPWAAPGEEPAAQRRSSMDKNRGVRLWGKKDLRKCFSVLSCGQRNTGRERGLLPVPTRGF